MLFQVLRTFKRLVVLPKSLLHLVSNFVSIPIFISFLSGNLNLQLSFPLDYTVACMQCSGIIVFLVAAGKNVTCKIYTKEIYIYNVWPHGLFIGVMLYMSHLYHDSYIIYVYVCIIII